MTNRERFLRVLNFEPVDRMPMLEWASWWDKTVERWKGEGLSIPRYEGLDEWQSLQKHMGLDLHLQKWYNFTGKDTPLPAYHGAPLATNMEEYEKLLPTLYNVDEAFDPEELRRFKKFQDTGEAVVWITLIGPFWGPRTILGIEPHLYAFYDEPELMHCINRDIANFNLQVMDRVFDVLTPDFMTFAEDMSYNNGPMVSEEMFDEFMLPYYRLQTPKLKEKGVRIIVDSDGDISKALGWFLRAGCEGILPLERQAGVDLAELREKYPKALFMGHFDKMTMPKGEAAMRREFERLLPVMKQGGFIPSVDHQTPPGVSLENYRIYLRLFAEFAELAAK